LQFHKEFIIVRNTLLNETDYPLLIDKIGDSSIPIAFLDIFLTICHEREGDVRFFDKLLERFHIVATDTNYLCIKILKFFQITLEISQFTCSDRGKYSKVEGQDNIFLSGIVAERNRALGRLSSERWCFLTDLESKRY